jgi:hypothetical protein
MARKFKDIQVTEIQPCDICTAGGHRPVRPGIYDAPMVGGPWANLCTTHMRQYVSPNCTIGYRRVVAEKIDPGLLTRPTVDPNGDPIG